MCTLYLLNIKTHVVTGAEVKVQEEDIDRAIVVAAQDFSEIRQIFQKSAIFSKNKKIHHPPLQSRNHRGFSCWQLDCPQ
jgi:hypothetical protein